MDAGGAQEAIAALRAAIDTVAALDPDTLSDAELQDVVLSTVQADQALTMARSATLSAWDTRRIWARDGSLTAAHHLARETGLDMPTAKRQLRRAKAVRRMPHTARAIREGRLTTDHLDLLARANTPRRALLFLRDEAALVEKCTARRFRDAARLVRRWIDNADSEISPDPSDPDTPPLEPERSVQVARTFHGAVHLRAMLDAVSGEIVLNELERLERELYLADAQAGCTRSREERLAAALVEMATRSATMPADGRRPAPLFVLHTGDTASRDLCRLGSLTDIRPHGVASWIDDAVMETVLFDGPTTVVSVSSRRTFTGVVRRAIRARDLHCQHPSGCDVPAHRCDGDHIVPFSQGGPTSQFNGRLECSTHNRHRDMHDHDAAPQPERVITRLDEHRVRVRWRLRTHLERTLDPPGEPEHPDGPVVLHLRYQDLDHPGSIAG